MQKNMQEEENVIDLRKVFATLWTQRKVFYWVLPITFVVSAALIMCVPRKYQSTVVLVPEIGDESGLSGSLGSLASSFGINIGGMSTTDAIGPAIYPNLVSSPDFLCSLFDIQVKSADEEISTSYYNYLLTMQKHPFWWYPKAWLMRMLGPKDVGGRPGTTGAGKNDVDLFWLNKKQLGVLSLMQQNINCVIDKKTDVITISVADQDKLICATIADSVSKTLQTFVTNYRTKKARVDVDYYGKMMEEASASYQEAYLAYANYADSHLGSVQERYKAELNRLNNAMEQRMIVYNAFQQQYIASCAKLQENTPVFTILQNASVPDKPSSPKRLLFVLAMLILSGITTSLILLIKHN